MSGGSGGLSGGPNGGAGYGAPFYPPGQTAPLTFMYYNWNDFGSDTRFNSALREPNFEIIQGVSVVIEPDTIMSGIVPQLQFLFANLPTGKQYKFCVHAPLSSLSATSYPFAVRPMTVGYAGRNPAVMQVPILSASNGPLVTAWVCTMFNMLQAIFTAAGPRFQLYALGLAPTSEIFFDAEFTVPSDVSENSAQAIANWATYGVTEAGITTFLNNHVTAIANGPGAGKVLTLPFLNPDLSSVGQNGDNGVSYTSHTKGMTDTLYALGLQFAVNDQSLNGQPQGERSEIVAAANYSGSYVCQFVGGVNLLPAVDYVLSRQAIWFEIGGSLLDAIVNLGWNGSALVGVPTQQSSVFVTT